MTPMMPVQPPINPFRVFYMLTGVTFFAFATGFSSCLFDMSQVKECVDYADQARDTLQHTGDHIIAWFIAVCQEVFRRYPLGG